MNPNLPTNSAEFINAFSHYYRAELSRMMSWRDRMDRTTNWAIGAAAAMLSVSLSSPTAHHGVLLFAMLLVYLLLAIESRRYRFFDVYRSRVRSLERNFYAPMLSGGQLSDPTAWAVPLAESLRVPKFTLTESQAMARRLRRNYCWIFFILLLAWMLKAATVLRPGQTRMEFVHSLDELFKNTAIAFVPGWVVLIIVLSYFAWMIYIMRRHRETPGELAYGEVHV
jgi:uncharacterized membrane protein